MSGNAINQSGGGIANAGTMSITGSTISGNTVEVSGYNTVGGGGIDNGGTLSITTSSISGNTTYGVGGGILNAGTLSISISTISENWAHGGRGFGKPRHSFDFRRDD